MNKQVPDYGLDAPGAFRALVIGGSSAAIVGFFLARWALNRHLGFATGMGFMALDSGIGCLISASLMFASSRFGKFHARDRLLARLKLRGDEALLDVGCGHGLLLIGAAKLLPHGRAVGVDLWSQVDQSDNSRDATLRNAALEGVAERVAVRDGDMRKLPFDDCIFDVAVAHFAIHNIPSHTGRREAIREIVRILKPGGHVALSDFKSVGLYAKELRKSGMCDVKVSGPSFWTWPPARTVTARKPSGSGDVVT
ncbi:MAG: class I SAM-dependent methyltransferase [Candidatus Acidiferrales bacterium]